MKYRCNIENFLIIFIFFFMTINRFATYSFMFIIFFIWFFKDDLKERVKILFHDRLSLIFLTLFLLHIVGLLWTQNIDDGLRVASKMKIYLLATFILTLMDSKCIKYAIISLMSAITLSEIYSIYLYLTQTPAPNDISFPSPFMHRMHYSLILAFAFGYFSSMIDLKNSKQIKNIIYLLLSSLSLITLFINRGRVGVVALIPIIFILAVQKFKLSILKSLTITIVLFTITITTAYTFSSQFKNRVDNALYEYKEVIGKNKRDSIACRFEMWGYAKELGMQKPIYGVGTGDTIKEMENLLGKDGLDKLYKECGLGIRYEFNPHNNFLLYFMQFGYIGLFILIFTLLLQYKIAFELNSIPMIMLISVTIVGMMTTSLISMHIKYICFYAFSMVLFYLEAKNRVNST